MDTYVVANGPVNDGLNAGWAIGQAPAAAGLPQRKWTWTRASMIDH